MVEERSRLSDAKSWGKPSHHPPCLRLGSELETECWSLELRANQLPRQNDEVEAGCGSRTLDKLDHLILLASAANKLLTHLVSLQMPHTAGQIQLTKVAAKTRLPPSQRHREFFIRKYPRPNQPCVRSNTANHSYFQIDRVHVF